MTRDIGKKDRPTQGRERQMKRRIQSHRELGKLLSRNQEKNQGESSRISRVCQAFNLISHLLPVLFRVLSSASSL